MGVTGWWISADAVRAGEVEIWKPALRPRDANGGRDAFRMGAAPEGDVVAGARSNDLVAVVVVALPVIAEKWESEDCNSDACRVSETAR